MKVIVMGVSGSGKSTIGKPLAERLGCAFLDADEFHPPQNVAKMASGTPLTDADRWPWLDLLNGKLQQHADVVLACSALKEAYRERLQRGLAGCRVVHLRGDIALIRARLKDRQHRYMPASLLDSQFATLELPRGAIDIDIAKTPEECVERILAAIRH